MKLLQALLALGLLGGCQNGAELGPGALKSALQISDQRNPLQARLIKSWKRRDLIFEEVQFRGCNNQIVPVLLCYSEMGRFRPLPVVLCMPGTPNKKEDLLRPFDLIPRWADQGFFVLSIDRPYHGEREGDLENAISEKGLLKVWGESVCDLMRALDYVESRSEAAADRVGMLGLSMGGVEALFIAALDSRVKVVVSVGGQLSWEEVFRENAWEKIFGGLGLGRKLIRSGSGGEQALKAFREAYPGLDQADAALVAAKVAPKPLLLLSGEKDSHIPPAAARKVYEVARRSYAAMGKEQHLKLWIEPDAGHNFPPDMEGRALKWFKRWL